MSKSSNKGKAGKAVQRSSGSYNDEAHAAKPLIPQGTIGDSEIGQSRNRDLSLAAISQSVIGQSCEGSSARPLGALEALIKVARAFPLPWMHCVRLVRTDQGFGSSTT